MKMLKSKLLDLKEKEHKEEISDLKGEQKKLHGEVKFVPTYFAHIPW